MIPTQCYKGIRRQREFSPANHHPMSEALPPSAPKPLISALRRLLRPIIKLLIAKGVGLPALLDILKSVYIGVALEEFPTNGKKTTDSRISLMTGVHRKDVKRLRTDEDEGFVAPRSIGIGAMVIARWLGSARTTDAGGQPIPLPRQPERDGGPSFDSLVARLDEKGRVVLSRSAFVPEKGLEEKAFFLGRNIHDHLAASVHNVLGAGNPMLERSVHYSGLSGESVKTIAETAERMGMQSLLAINRLALELADKDKSVAGADRRVNFGLYLFQGPSTVNAHDKSDSAK
jgi:Family of unknown function (DUF6502)